MLKGLSLDIPRGKTVVIMGRSGIGKSVTLKHIVGLMKPDKGSVMVDGVDVTKLTGAALEDIRRKFGFLFQSSALLNSLNVFENVSLPLREHTNLTRSEMEKVVKEKLALVKLENVEHLMPDELSGGMKKRVGLARAIIREPEIILYDEPTTGLDPPTADSINDMIIDMKRKLKITSVVVTHDLHCALKVGDLIALIEDGVITEKGTPQEFMRSSNATIQSFLQSIGKK